ncbi:MAG: LysR substrate-binding domain-containing protein [Bosea sp. (in: a-proteobacteria)]
MREISIGIEQVAQRHSVVRVALLPMFASRFVSPHLSRLQQDLPNVEVVLLNHNNSFVEHADPLSFADFGIQWGLGGWSKFQAIKLWDERLVAVCSPDYQARLKIERPEDVSRCTLLHVDDKRMWKEWVEQCGTSLRADQPSMMLEDRHFQLSSTINGLGISLFVPWLVTGELNSGALINPFGRSYETSFGYHLVVPRGPPLSPGAKQVWNWFLDLASQTDR